MYYKYDIKPSHLYQQFSECGTGTHMGLGFSFSSGNQNTINSYTYISISKIYYHTKNILLDWSLESNELNTNCYSSK